MCLWWISCRREAHFCFQDLPGQSFCTRGFSIWNTRLSDARRSTWLGFSSHQWQGVQFFHPSLCHLQRAFSMLFKSLFIWSIIAAHLFWVVMPGKCAHPLSRSRQENNNTVWSRLWSDPRGRSIWFCRQFRVCSFVTLLWSTISPHQKRVMSLQSLQKRWFSTLQITLVKAGCSTHVDVDKFIVHLQKELKAPTPEHLGVQVQSLGYVSWSSTFRAFLLLML